MGREGGRPHGSVPFLFVFLAYVLDDLKRFITDLISLAHAIAIKAREGSCGIDDEWRISRFHHRATVLTTTKPLLP